LAAVWPPLLLPLLHVLLLQLSLLLEHRLLLPAMCTILLHPTSLSCYWS
jgi:hypothetical protein